MDIDKLIDLSVKQKASDLHLSAGQIPMMRIAGALRPGSQSYLQADCLYAWLLNLLDKGQKERFHLREELDFSHSWLGIRMRINLFYQRMGAAAALRFINERVPDAGELHLPPVVLQQVSRADGLLLISGATGSGKSTSLAALIAEINQSSARHILTLEDPIEFIHHSAKSLVQQRNIGLHSRSFSDALRAALREDPDVIVIGELRDKETIRLALTAAETGHLVMASLHSRDAVQAIERVVDIFSDDDKGLIRSQLAGCLNLVVNQKLLSNNIGGLRAAYEVLVNTPAVENLIREGKSHQIASLIQTGSRFGMQTMAQSIKLLDQNISLK